MTWAPLGRRAVQRVDVIPSGIQDRLGEVRRRTACPVRRSTAAAASSMPGVGVDPSAARLGASARHRRTGTRRRGRAGDAACTRAGRRARRARRCPPRRRPSPPSRSASLVSDASRKRRSRSPNVADARAVGTDDGGGRRGRPPSGRRARAPASIRPSGGAAGDQLGEPERQVEALAGVEARVADRLVAVVEVGVGAARRHRRGTR